MHFDGFIFDLDGTLWDTTEVIALAWNKALEELQIQPGSEINAHTVAGIAGLAREAIFETVFPMLDAWQRNVLSQKAEYYENLFLAQRGGVLYPGVKELVPQLARHYPLFIVSNCQVGYIEHFLSYSELGPYFKDHACYGEVQLAKWQNIRLIAERNELQSPVYIGDTRWDQEAAAKAGVPFMAAGYGFGKLPVTEGEGLAAFSDLKRFLTQA